jgi:hypothetical protein
VGLFAIGAAGIILLNRPELKWTRRAICLAALMCGAAVESAIDLCFSNVLVLVALLLAFAGETYYETLRSGWSRWSEAVWSLAKTPFRWLWLIVEVGKQAAHAGPMPPGSVRKVARIVWIAAPGMVVTLFFALILSDGNVLFQRFTAAWANALRDWMLDLSFWRLCLWAFVAWVALPLLRPSPPPGTERIWTREIPRLPEFMTAGTARLQTMVMLGLLNALFCCVNTIDALYLWAHQKLPADVSYSAFVHQGVSSLIIAVILSAGLLAGMFHQAPGIARWTPLRLLGLLWIGQNVALLAGVFLRVKLYVDAFDLTVTRVNLVLFLALVTAGFALLAIHIWRQRSLGWLLHANMLSAFFLFYAIQFLDMQGFVARYNVDLWLPTHGTRILDLAYLESLGPPAFDSIQTVAQSGYDYSGGAATYLKTARTQAQEQLNETPWASWQLRKTHCQQKLLSTTLP